MPPRTAAPYLRVEGLACARGGRLLFSGFDLRVAAGSAVQVAGANGCGKTTLLRALSGLLRPEAGRVLWRGEDIHRGEGYAGALLYLAHENALNPDLTAAENLGMLTALHGGDGRAVGSALATFGLAAAADRVCGRLSAGQRRRCALARLLLESATVWLLDEPAAALDAAGRQTLGRIIAGQVADGGLVVFTTHEPLALPGVTATTVAL